MATMGPIEIFKKHGKRFFIFYQELTSRVKNFLSICMPGISTETAMYTGDMPIRRGIP